MQNLTLKKAIHFVFYQHIESVLITLLICFATYQYFARPQSQSFEQIQESGRLRVLISDDPDTQYTFNNEHYGFEYELLSSFAKSIGAELDMKVVPYGELFTLLNNGNADIAVGGILMSPFIESVAQPTQPWYQSRLAVVYKRGTKRPKQISQLNDIPVLSSARFYQLPELSEIQILDDYRSEYQLLSAIDRGEVRYAVSTEYRARNAKHYLPNLNRAFHLSDKSGLVWVLPKRHDKPLLAVLNQFLDVAVKKDLPNKLAKQHLDSPKRLETYDTLAIHKKIETVLPEFEYAFRRAARRGNIDWTLLAAIAYQESHWTNSATSPTGVRGIMQITNETAEFLGIEDRMNMDETIEAAAKYIRYLRSKLPKSIKEPERTWFAVGAYNVGLKHILYAHKKARKRGLNANQWNTIQQLLPTLYGQRFPRGIQAKDYVEKVQIFTDIMRFYDIHQKPSLTRKAANRTVDQS